MPEMTVTVRWPDGRVLDCYSPSLVMHDHLQAGSSYRVDDFTRRSETALHMASERVRVKYGFACTASAASLEQIHRLAAGFAADSVIEVLAMTPPLPKDKS
ncbi:MAG: family nitrogen starvation response protein [Aeromicrobium sp.]|nr:family nitrogen starvation response protein [Aeromicrobium sp.]